MKYLITYSLLNSWKYWLNYNDNSTHTSQGFKHTLNKEFFDNKFMKAGRAFEKFIRDYMNSLITLDINDPYQNCVYEIEKSIKGGTWQTTGNKTITIDNQEFVLHAKTDVLRGPEIFDIKYVRQYESGKYFNSIQHKLYFEVLEYTDTFIYLISDGKEVYYETYTREETESIIPIISDFWSWINQFPEYFKIYQEKWNAK